MKKIYFDHNATTPIHPSVIRAMQPFVNEKFGNPSSIHWAGREVKVCVEKARDKIISLINADSSEIIFTSSGLEGAICQ